MPDREPTRAALLAQIATMEQGIDDLRTDRDNWRRSRLADDEAEAMSECVKALDALRERGSRTRPGFTVGGVTTWEFGNPMFRRILKYLADRYGVTWPEAHVDTELVEAARAVTREWDQRGDGGCVLALQQRLRQALEEVRHA